MKLARDNWKSIWRKARQASHEEQWKWDYHTWAPILEKIWEGDTDHLICPICGKENVYFKYLAVYENEIGGERQIHGERWVGCESCSVQFHDRARLPSWLKEPEWIPTAEE